MDSQASQMAVQVNELVGEQLCSELEKGDIVISSVQVTVIFDNNKVSILVSTVQVIATVDNDKLKTMHNLFLCFIALAFLSYILLHEVHKSS